MEGQFCRRLVAKAPLGTTLVDSGALHDVRTVIFLGTIASPGATVNVSWTGGISPRVSATAQEWSNLTDGTDGVDSIDVVGTVAPVGITTTNNSDLVLAVGGHNLSETVFNPGIPWKLLNATSGTVPSENPAYQIVSSPLSFNPIWSWATSIDGAAAIVALRSAGSKSTPTPTPSPTPTPTPTPSGQPTPPPLNNPQNPVAYGADSTGASDSGRPLRMQR
jgi:hypothetical protein